MSFPGRSIFALLLFVSLPVFAQTAAPQPPPDPQELEIANLIATAGTLIGQGRAADALTQAIDPAIVKADAKLAAESRKVYTARTMEESLLYMTTAATGGQSAVVYHVVWSQPYFLKGYILNELGRTADARLFIQRALDMAPMNAQYLIEMGNLETKAKDWDAGLKIFLKAEEAANVFTPQNTKAADLAKALRGQGFVYVEMNRLEEAEAIYRRCLSNDPNDKRAAGELQYVLQQRAKQAAPGH